MVLGALGLVHVGEIHVGFLKAFLGERLGVTQCLSLGSFPSFPTSQKPTTVKGVGRGPTGTRHHGPVIIRDPADPILAQFQYTAEEVLMIGDAYHRDWSCQASYGGI